MRHSTLFVALCASALVLGACTSTGVGRASPTAVSTVTVPATATSTELAALATPERPQPSPTLTAVISERTGEVTPSATGVALVTVEWIKSSPDQLRDKLVQIKGLGLDVATLPLCPGHVGFDKRVTFRDDSGETVFATDKLPSGVRRWYSEPKVFEGYVRLFSGEVGCPGRVKQETFPYLEITGVEGGAASPVTPPSVSPPAPPAPSPFPTQTSSGTVLVDDQSLVKLTALANPEHRMWWATDFILEVEAQDPTRPVQVSYLVTDSNGTPANPTTGVEVRGNSFIAGWDPGKQYYFYTEVGSQAQPVYAANPQFFPLPHYRTCVMVLGGHDVMYVVFLRENDGQVTYYVLKGGSFDSLDVPDLARVTWQEGGRFEIRSYGGPVEVGLWVNGRYQHDEVAGRALPEFRPNPKYYSLDHYAGRSSLGMFLLMIARYGRLGLIIGNESEGKIGGVVLAGSHIWEKEAVPGLADLTSLIPRTAGAAPKIEVRATGGSPVEVSHFGFDNTCWQWEVNGTGPNYEQNPQSFVLKHYTPGFIMVSRYGKAGVFFYNENDGRVGVLPLTSSR